jgi:hypothetical protein
MRKTFEVIALGKKVDIVFQSIVFAIMIFLFISTSWSFFWWYLMAGAQLLSCIVWVVALKSDVPKPKGRDNLRKAIIIVCVAIACSIFLDVCLFIFLSASMIIIGPLLGVNYFLQTVDELKYYSNARKPYYLL